MAGGELMGRSDDGLCIVRRTGPFVAKLSCILSGPVIATAEFRETLQRQVPYVQFRPVILEAVIWSEWNKVDFTRENAITPEIFGDEPGEPIWNGEHSDEAAAGIGELWEVVLPVAATGSLKGVWEGLPTRFLHRASLVHDLPFFEAHMGGGTIPIVNESMREWLANEVGHWISFSEIDAE